MKNSFKINGGKQLKGELVPQGAKNEALQVISAVLLTEEEVVIHNVPNIEDVNKLIDLLVFIGVEISQIAENSWKFRASNIQLKKLYEPEFRKIASTLRGSILTVGPLLSRFKQSVAAQPGGDKIGRRRLDTHFIGFQNIGAKVEFDSATSFYHITADKLQGTQMLLDEASVTGTGNVIMAATMAEGTTTVFNAACEPYIQQLCKMLKSMGLTSQV
jgi:UDP-N-acetylglucosamine 1-carboxyvinyltransferase